MIFVKYYDPSNKEIRVIGTCCVHFQASLSECQSDFLHLLYVDDPDKPLPDPSKLRFYEVRKPFSRIDLTRWMALIKKFL